MRASSCIISLINLKVCFNFLVSIFINFIKITISYIKGKGELVFYFFWVAAHDLFVKCLYEMGLDLLSARNLVLLVVIGVIVMYIWILLSFLFWAIFLHLQFRFILRN